MTHTAFDSFHPVVAVVYFAVAVVLGMAAMQPVFICLGVVAALAYHVLLQGWGTTVRSLRWQIPLVAVLAVANMLFSSVGSTELFRIGPRAFYMESMVFGLFMGLLLLNIMVVFANASRVLTTDKVLCLFGSVLPTLGLMLSMIMRLVPQFAKRGKHIAGVQRACTAAQGASGVGSIEGVDSLRKRRKSDEVLERNLRLSSVLMGWGMEDSLETADAMKARGWGSSKKRTTYARYRFDVQDALALGMIVILAVVAAVTAFLAWSTFKFYPTIDGWAAWPAYVPYALFLLIPFGLQGRERLLWS